MALNIDMSRALRKRHALTELVNAIVAAPPSTQETRAVEWKSVVDLGTKLWRVRLAKGVLAFANRDPAVAAQWFEGCAYLVVGAEPGNVVGTTVHDAAKVEDFLEPYVGRGPSGPQWTPTYVTASGKDVLVLTIEAPRPGDPIWPFRRKFNDPGERSIEDGDIFVRQLASTEKASSADIDMLSRRARSTGTRLSGLSLSLLNGARAVAVNVSREAIAAWVEKEGASLAAPPEPPSPVARPPVRFKDADPLAQQHSLQEVLKALDTSALTAKMFQTPDPRSHEQYRAEVEAYLAKASKRLPNVLMRAAVRNELGRVDLSLKNATGDNYHEVEVELHVDIPGAMAFFDTGDIPGKVLPAQPVAFGKGGRNRLDSLYSFHSPLSSIPSTSDMYIRRGSIDNGASSRITLEPVDVRPRRSAELGPFYLVLPPEYADKTITVAWTATATDASGDMAGTIDIPVDGSVPSTEWLLAPTSGDDDGESDYFESDDE